MQIVPFNQLPADQQTVNATFDFAYGIVLICLYSESKQSFLVVQSVLIVPAYKVLTWESITL